MVCEKGKKRYYKTRDEEGRGRKKDTGKVRQENRGVFLDWQWILNEEKGHIEGKELGEGRVWVQSPWCWGSVSSQALSCLAYLGSPSRVTGAGPTPSQSFRCQVANVVLLVTLFNKKYHALNLHFARPVCLLGLFILLGACVTHREGLNTS